MLNENEVLIQLGMRFPSGALRYSDIIVKEIKTEAFFQLLTLEHVKIEILLTC